MEELAGGDGGDGGRITTKKSPPKSQKKKANTSDDGIYAGYVPSKLSIKGAKPHPAVLVESSAMAAVAAPEITYVPNIAQDVIEKGLISDVQLENISYAGQATPLAGVWIEIIMIRKKESLRKVPPSEEMGI